MKAHRGGSHLATNPLLVAYFPLGDPDTPIEWLDVYAESGVDFVEFGWPARDPYLDGPDVRTSMARASPSAALAALTHAKRRLGARAAPPRSLLMTYAEALHPGLDNNELFCALDAVLVVGSPANPLRMAMEAGARRTGAAICAFLPLPLRADDIGAARRADGYAMLQAAPGVTGPRQALDPSNGERIALLRREGVAAPVVLGFGVSQAAHARAAVKWGADGIVVGSAALRAARAGRAELGALLKELRGGLDG
jgi:tryptophan synthase alpha chain